MLIQVSYEIGDVMHHDFEANSFDVVYSRDTILHITDKMSLFSRLYVRLIVFRNYFVLFVSIE
jgi:2-polyprenyl-3-methyl-5-hydroxy-6-metoxy-1,4-benzoquinol methylase